MAVYQSTDHLLQNMQSLFQLIGEDPAASRAILNSRMLIRLRCSSPPAEIYINGRTNPVKITYGPTTLRPDLDIDVTADVLHQILLGQLSLTKAVGSGAMKVKGPVWKTAALEPILKRGQTFYPEIWANTK